MDLRSTLNLPDPNFTIPMKADLPKLELRIQAEWAEQGIYHVIQRSRENAPTFVLHDGPPYTNSPIHIGTALNKLLKDFVLKSRTMMGFRVPYVPGFDTHGLPIEQAVTKKFAEKKLTPTKDELRKACREHVAEFIGVQTTQFQRLGIFGLWERPYATLDFQFEAEIIRVFRKLVEAGYVYRGLRPTLWSPTLRTALADTEIVYKDHVSKAIYVRFPLLEDPNKILEKYDSLFTIIWTTTPWTIPSNLAVAFHPDFDYAVVKVGLDHYIVAQALVPKIANAVGWEHYEIVETFVGINFEGMTFKHPIFDRPSIAVHADYVTAEDGTGVVHTAPSHGRDDFYTGQKYGLPVPNTVNEGGVLTSEAGEFAGVHYTNCDTVIVDRLRETGSLLSVSDYSHSYPHAERDEKPVIFRATEQWFVSIEHNSLRAQMLEEIEGVTWLPKSGQARIESMVKNRPDWCISRQRFWGVGVPIFYGKDSAEPVLDPVAINAIADVVEQGGSDAWFALTPEEILPPGYSHPVTGETEFRKETDTLDVWFDSGATSLVVLEGQVFPEWVAEGLTWPADLYLEGSDQHRGWFNTSLILGTALKGKAPYKAVLTHGFVTHADGEKMSKRAGNTIDPVKASDQYGADILRYWVASVDYSNDVPCSDNLLKQFSEGYRTVRNTFRFLLGNLGGFDPAVEVELLPLDEWVCEQTDLLVAEAVQSYEAYNFGAVIGAVHNFCAKELSKFYLDAIKDRMYCDATDSDARASSQRASHYVLVALVKLVAPILVHTAEETWQRIPGVSRETIHGAYFMPPTEERLREIEGSDLQVLYATVKGVRDDVFVAFEAWKSEGHVKDSQDAVLSLTVPAEVLKWLSQIESSDLANLFKMSWVELRVGDFATEFHVSTYLKCERSRLRRPDVEEVDVDGVMTPLTKRDRIVIGR